MLSRSLCPKTPCSGRLRGNTPCMRRVSAVTLVLSLKPDHALPGQQQPDRCADVEEHYLPVSYRPQAHPALPNHTTSCADMLLEGSCLGGAGGLPGQWSNMTHLLELDLHQNQLGGMWRLPQHLRVVCSCHNRKICNIPASFMVTPEVPCGCRGPPAVVGRHAQPAEDQYLAEQPDRCAA